MTNPETEQNSPALDQAARELHAALRRVSQIWKAPGHDMRLNGV